MSRCQIITADVLDGLAQLPDQSVHCCITSPPYYGLRDYGVDGQIGMERTPAEYIERMVAVFREVRRVLRADGTLWINVGDSYAGGGANTGGSGKRVDGGEPYRMAGLPRTARGGLKPKDLMMMPARLAIALQDDGWYLRCDIIWSKPNPMPESVTDRPTKAHEYLFLLAKSERYYYDAAAIAEPAEQSSIARWSQQVEMQEGSHRANGGAKTNGTMKAVGGPHKKTGGNFSRVYAEAQLNHGAMALERPVYSARNKRSVWNIPTEAYPDAHFAVFPTALVKPCVLAGCPEDGTVLDPFMGSGTTGLVAMQYGRNFIGIELNREYVALAEKRLAPVLAQELLPL